jgi:hypothetical protein
MVTKMSKKQEKQKQQSELEALRNLTKEPLTEGQVMGGFILSLGSIVVGLNLLIWVNVATPGLQAATPLFTGVARSTIMCVGAAVMGLGSLCLVEMWRELTRLSKDYVLERTSRQST